MAGVKELTSYVMEWAHTGGQENSECFSVYVSLLRRRKGLTRTVLATQTGIKEETLVAIENCLISWKKIKPDQVQRLEICLDMSYRDFLDVYSQLVLCRDD